MAEAIRGLVKQVDLLYKLAARVADLPAGDLAGADDAVCRRLRSPRDRPAGQATR